ncbi:MAG: hypothetical protein QFX36_02020 [Archaeoglobales archaeon]|nr:hypothetical protein [Archaeoglobales archaeon]
MRNAVSEVTSYIYIFGIVMTVLAIVFVQVNSMVEDMKRSVLSKSLEQSFKKIQYLIYSVAFGDVPSQIAEIELQGGSMLLEKDKSGFIIAFVNSSGSISDCSPLPQNFHFCCLNQSTASLYGCGSVSPCVGIYDKRACILNTTVGELKYKYRDWILSMEAGAVFSKYGNSDYSKLLYEPRILLNTTAGTSKYLVITVPSLEGNLSLAGSGRFRFTIEEGSWNYVKIDNINSNEIKEKFENITLIVKSTEHQDAWCKFFERKDFKDLFNPNFPEIGKNCRTADDPMVKVERSGEKQEVVILFKKVKLYS